MNIEVELSCLFSVQKNLNIKSEFRHLFVHFSLSSLKLLKHVYIKKMYVKKKKKPLSEMS